MRIRKRAMLAGAGCMLAASCAAWLRLAPLPAGFLDAAAHVSTQVVDRNGELLYESLSAEASRSRWLKPDELPEPLVRATLAAEDQRFFSHAGIDPIGSARALWRNLRAGRFVEGGSTLTQQVVKRLTSRPRSLRGKLREAVLALRLEHRLAKREILALYLNVAPYGNQYLGADAASRGYFGCPPRNLTSAQAAFLAGLPQRPSVLDPYRNLEGARRRQQLVLSRMSALGFLSRQDEARARAEELRIERRPKPFVAPHFVDSVLASLDRDAPRRVETTLDARLQAELQGILAMHKPRLRALGAHNVAVAVLHNESGEWLAWEGSGAALDGAHGGAIDGVTAPRQPGSALKPFTYALAFESGLTPASVLPDVPSQFPTAVAGVLYSPRNYDGVFRGPLRARPALAGSENVPAVWTLSRVGVPSLLLLLRKLGLTTLDRTPDYYGYGLTMGDAEVRLGELVGAYAALARGGIARPTRALRGVVASDGRRERFADTGRPADAGERVLSERAAFWIADILSDPRARAYIFGSGGSLDFPFPVAVKTGTSQSYHDNWTVGFTREISVGVWVGNFDRSPLQSSTGVSGAAPIFHDVLLAAQKRVTGRLPGAADPPLVERPRGLVLRPICTLSGSAATEMCAGVTMEWLPEDLPLHACTWHKSAGRRRVVDWPDPYRSWAMTRGFSDAAADEPVADRASERAHAQRSEGRAVTRAIGIENPASGALYLKDPTLRDAFQTLPLRAVVAGRPRPLLWEVDGRDVGRSPSDRPLHWPLQVGEHTITVRDAAGQSATTSILVR